MKKFYTEFTAGVFMLVGIACLAWLSIRLGGLDVAAAKGYEVSATFSNIGGLRKGAEVVIAGVRIGGVTDVILKDYMAEVTMSISQTIELPKGSIAAIKTRGLIGEQFITISPGGEAENIPHGGRIRETQSAVNLIDLAAKYGFGDVDDGGKDDKKKDDSTLD